MSQSVISLKSFNSLLRQLFSGHYDIVSNTPFLKNAAKTLMQFDTLDMLQFWIKDNHSKYQIMKYNRHLFTVRTVFGEMDGKGNIVPKLKNRSFMNELCLDIMQGNDCQKPYLFSTPNGSYWINDTSLVDRKERCPANYTKEMKKYGSLAVIQISMGDEKFGLFILQSRSKKYFNKKKIEFYEDIARMLMVVVSSQRAQLISRERVKELTCLYKIARIAQENQAQIGTILQTIVEFLPLAWLYPEFCSAQITFDNRVFSTKNFREGLQKMTAEIVIREEIRGSIVVGYFKKMPELDEGPFLTEERNLIAAVAREIALIIEHKIAKEDRLSLQDQLRHADRLATIGQLTAGVAHELNEPLSNILGFAQLMQKSSELPSLIALDIEKIIKASLHAREVIKKLMLFSRQTPPQKNPVNLNKIVEEGLYFLESRCKKADITLERSLSKEIPNITADTAQIYQVLVNLVVNAIQAMPEGGMLRILTCDHEDYVSLIVEDTGVGMTEDTKKHIFIPFFTTKDMGTGLGLSVVHGIVSSHGGKIVLDTQPNQGSRFEIMLPKEDKKISGVKNDKS